MLDIASCAVVLGQAFHQDPLQIDMLPYPVTRQQVAPRQLEASLRYG
jgi:hypothetical protein